MIWRKPNPTPLVKCKRYWQAFEYMFVFSKCSPKTCNYIMEECKNAGKKASTYKQISKETGLNIDKNLITKDTKIKMNVWDYNLGYRETGGHPATFPEKLARDHIVSWSNEGDLVLDPMCGSGTTCKMAKMNGRQFIGIEISPEYIKIAEQRIKEIPQKLF
jgi:DNA modification methylase